MNLNRREAIARLAVLMGGVVIGAEAFLRGEPLAGKPAGRKFSDDDRALLDEIGETIIPTPSTPGAKATGIGAFMITMVNDCYDLPHHAAFQAGLLEIDQAAAAKFGKSFREASPEQRTALLNELDAAQKARHEQKAPAEPAHYFRLMKQLTILGYFTSEIGATQTLRYVETPGAYRSDPYQKGDRAWYVPAGAPGLYGDAAEGGKKPI